MSGTAVPVLLVTANVGSIFEDPERMLTTWTGEFLSLISRLKPKFVALHCQEVGGKNYANSMKHVKNFIRMLVESDELRAFDRVRAFLDEDFSSTEYFTALGNLYFVHESLQHCSIWDFAQHQFVDLKSGHEIHSGNIEMVSTKEKAKFPQKFFPECKWSRKGFLRTRWSIDGTTLDLINIHLFHDASNMVAIESQPSVYCTYRRRALEHTLQRFHNDTSNGAAPHFLFGDFNFRLDTSGVVQKLTQGLSSFYTRNAENSKVVRYTNGDVSAEDESDDSSILTIGKKEFHHVSHQQLFFDEYEIWLNNYDTELDAFRDHLTEMPITFPPTYPFEESINEPQKYMATRCPSWCDRVLFSHTAKDIIDTSQPAKYGVIGMDVCMGDHKPVFLSLDLLSAKGTVQCCAHDNRLASHDDRTTLDCRCCQLYDFSVRINVVDLSHSSSNALLHNSRMIVDAALLHEPPQQSCLGQHYGPYTPESVESHSPYFGDTATVCEEHTTSSSPGSVSAQQLKSRLEDIILVSNQMGGADGSDACSKAPLDDLLNRDFNHVVQMGDGMRACCTPKPKSKSAIRRICCNLS